MIDPVTEQTVPLFHPQLQGWKEHFSWNEDASEIVGRTDIGRVTILTLKMNRPQLVRVQKMWVISDLAPFLISLVRNGFENNFKSMFSSNIGMNCNLPE
jgi:hypothetical protein